MLPFACRIKQRDVFTQVYRRGQRRSGSLCTLRWLAIPQLDSQDPSLSQTPTDPNRTEKGAGASHSRAAIVASKKVSKKAVVRNRVRRRFWAVFAGLWVRIQPGYWIVVTVHSQAIAVTWQQLTTELEQMLQKAKLMEPLPDSEGPQAEKDIKIGKAR